MGLFSIFKKNKNEKAADAKSTETTAAAEPASRADYPMSSVPNPMSYSQTMPSPAPAPETDPESEPKPEQNGTV